MTMDTVQTPGQAVQLDNVPPHDEVTVDQDDSTQRNATKEFLDSKQYTSSGLQMYENIFGEAFLSSGGLQTTEEIVSRLGLTPGQTVLDIGCGLGGSAFYMAKEFGAKVAGIDLSENMISMMNGHLKRLEEQGATSIPTGEKIVDLVQSYEEDIFNVGTSAQSTEISPSAPYDVAYSRDAFLHIADKPALFEKIFSLLKDGGKLLLSDYAYAPPPHTAEFLEYLDNRQYRLTTLDDYVEIIKAAGFINVRGEDATVWWTDILKREHKKLQDMKDDFINKYGQEGYEKSIANWESKIVRSTAGEQRWAVISAEKPKSS